MLFYNRILECKISIPCTTVTKKEHSAELPELSVNLMVTVVDPNGKNCPGLWVIVRCGVIPELSVAVGFTHDAEPLVAVLGTMTWTAFGQLLMTGGVVSPTAVVQIK